MIHYRRPLRLRRSINRLRPYPADDTAAMATYDAHLLALDAVQAAQRAMDDYQFRFTRTLATEARTVAYANVGKVAFASLGRCSPQ